MKKILAISWAMPPILCPQTIQISRIIETISNFNFQTTTICADTQDVIGFPIDRSLLSIYPKQHIIPVPLSIDQKRQEEDDLYSRWLKPALDAIADLYKSQHFDILVTFAQPWVDHLVGLELKRKFNIPWIAHFSDPWVDSIYYAHIPEETRAKWAEMEADIINLADMTIWTNQYGLDLVMRKYPQKFSQARVLHHAYDNNLIQKVRSSQKHNRFALVRSCEKLFNLPHKCRFVYIGNVYGKRSPEGLFKAVEMLSRKTHLHNRFEIYFIGEVAPEFRSLAKKYHLKNSVRFFPTVSYLDSLNRALQADVLLTLDAPHPGSSPFLPSKLIDYLGLGLPILGITQPNGASSDILRGLGYPTAHPGEPAEIADAIETLISSCNASPSTVNAETTLLRQSFEMQHIGKLMDQYLREIVAG